MAGEGGEEEEEEPTGTLRYAVPIYRALAEMVAEEVGGREEDVKAWRQRADQIEEAETKRLTNLA